MAGRHALALILFAGACKGVPEPEFIVEYEELFCEGYALCASDEMLRVVNERECHEYLRYQQYPDPTSCRYDRQAAEACLENFTSAGCLNNDPEMPASCDDVYSQCPLPQVPREDGTIHVPAGTNENALGADE